VVLIDVQGGKARHVTRAIGHNRKPEIHMQSLEISAQRVRRRNVEIPDNVQGRHACSDGVRSSRLVENGSRARPRELLAVVWRAEMHDPDVQELGGSRGSIDPS
jgi:hypothetical protein